MPDKPDTWAIALAWLSQHSPILYAAALSCAMAVLRITYGGGTRRQMLVEGAIFGGLTLTIISGLDFFGLPQSMSVLIDATDVAKGCGVPATSGAGGVDHAGVRVQLDLAHAQQIIAITHEGDRGLIALQACQA